jgi:hypothetical protein
MRRTGIFCCARSAGEASATPGSADNSARNSRLLVL